MKNIVWTSVLAVLAIAVSVFLCVISRPLDAIVASGAAVALSILAIRE